MPKPPVVSQPSRPVRARKNHALAERSPAWRAGVIGTVIAHVLLALLVFWLPKNYFLPDTPTTEDAASRSFQIELSTLNTPPSTALALKEELKAELEKKPVEPEKEDADKIKNPIDRFLMVNTAAPENTPDRTLFLAAQDQQVAQPIPSPSDLSRIPTVDQNAPDPGMALVTGSQLRQRSSLTVPSEALPKQSPDEKDVEPSPEPKLVIQSTAEKKIESPKGSGEAANLTIQGKEGNGYDPRPAQSGVQAGRIEGEGYFARTPKIDRNRPMPRRFLKTNSLPDAASITTIHSNLGTIRVGVVAADARWSDFGEYMTRLCDSISLEAEKTFTDSSVWPTRGTVVEVTFRINRQGNIAEIVEVKGPDSIKTKFLCVSAITARDPYGIWPKGMVDTLGESQTITFGFRF